MTRTRWWRQPCSGATLQQSQQVRRRAAARGQQARGQHACDRGWRVGEGRGRFQAQADADEVTMLIQYQCPVLVVSAAGNC